ncbi:hypothetical protein CRM22_001081 [Opisthorchis felineus]|uniref:YEATS domain-containing protein n=1 Tax=Opisthorchis felineus TaxID=147828 RepID=A0A4V3SGY8_OPIFE|nr:hypothetical protein CRM22_001081 [Opisthorchis felineus]TGZ74174.1 hypothetical protein CRM22_001081 [Opisthorchis felineus]
MDRQILFVFKVGHSVQRRAKPLSNRTHHWRCYVDSWNPNYPLSALVRKVTFWLHDTFENPRQVVRQPPFAIEEDGFGHFQLQIEVAFLDCVTTFTYDLRLFDNNALHTYRTVRVIPAAEDWDRMIHLGGIVIPRTNTPADIHKVVQTIQSCNNLESMHSYSFFPHLRDRSEQDAHSLSPASVGSAACKPSDSIPFYPETTGRLSAGQDYCFDYQDETCSGSLTHSDPDIPRQSVLSVERLLAQRPLPQKHKKKLQLLHEAQLLLEDAQKRQSQWASSRPVTARGSGSPQYNLMPLSPDIPTPSKGAPPLESAGEQEEMEPPLSTDSLSVSKDQNDSDSIPDRKSGFETAEPSSPVKRIVLKLSRLGSKNQLVVASSDLEGQDIIDERQERRRRKKEQRREQARMEEEKAKQFAISESKTENLSLKPDELLTHEAAAAAVTGYADVKSPRKLKKHRRLKAGKRAAIDALDQPIPLTSSKANLTSRQLSDLVKLESESRKAHLSPEGITASQCMGPVDLNTAVQPESEFHGHIGPFVEHELFGSDDEPHLLCDQTNQYSPKVSSPFEHGAHSHLLLDNPDEEFDDALSRSLFSQCHESTNPGSPVDLFGDEDRLSSAHTTPYVVRYPASSPNESTGSRPYDPEDLLTSKPRPVGGELCEDTGDECMPLSRHSSTDRSEKSTDFGTSRPSHPLSKSRLSKVSTDSSTSGADHGRPVSRSHKKHKKSDKQKSQMKCDQQESVSREQACISSSASKTVPEKVDSDIPRSHSVNMSTDFRKQHARSSSSHSSSSCCGEKERKKINSNSSKHMHPNTSKHREQIHTPKIQSSSPKIKPPKSGAVGKPRKQISADETETSDRKVSDSKRSHVSKDLSTTKAKKTDARKQNYSHKPLAGESVGARKEHLRSQSGHRRTATLPPDSKHSSKGPSPQERHKKYLKRFKEHDIELSSLSSSSSPSVSSSPTPPMSSCNSLFSGTANELGCFDKAHKSQPRQSVPSQVTKHSGDKRSKKKINPPPTCGPAQLETTGISNEKQTAAVKSATSEPAKSLDTNIEPQLSGVANNQSKYSGSQLENLFDRLLRLQQPHLAIRMSEILLQYLVPRSPTSTSKSQTNEAAAEAGSKVKSGRAVKVLNEGEPRLIAFNLRRLPFVCLDQLSELIAEDEAISCNLSDGANVDKHASTASELMSPSKDLVL